MMRFPHRKKPVDAGSSNGASPPPPTPPQPRSVVWRSLWNRVYSQWLSTSVRSRVSSKQPPKDDDAKTTGGPHGLRDYFHRKRGERWFLMRRCQDCELHAPGDAEEVEMSPPPLVLSTESPKPLKRELQSLFSLVDLDSVLSELEVNMSSYSHSSHSSSSDDLDAEEKEEELDGDDRDSYATTEGTSDDPFLQRHSSWCSVDDEQTFRRGETKLSDDDDEEEEEEEEDSDNLGQSPTLEALYGVHHVDLGNPTSDSGGIWV